MPARFRVVAAAAVARVPGPRREVYVYRGSLLPVEVDAAESARLVKRGLVVEVAPAEDAPETEEAPEPAKPQARKPAAK